MNKKQTKKIVDQAVKAVFIDGKLSESKALKAIKVFKSRPRFESITLLSSFLKGIKREQERTTLVVEAATPLTKSEIDGIKRKLSSEFLIINSEFILNPSLLGGIKVKIGDHIFEDSIMSRLTQVKEVLTN